MPAAALRRITEIGIAVPDLEAATRLLVDLLGAEAGPVRTVERYSMRFRMCRLGQVDLEVMESIDGRGVIADFLRKRGPGLHHVAFAVDDLEATMAALRARGVEFVDEAPVPIDLDGLDFAGRPYSGEIRIAFTRPRSLLGVLFELIEYPPGYDAS